MSRIVHRLNRTRSLCLERRPAAMRNDSPIISFSFDDFPVSAARTGDDILRRCGVRGTYYVALGLLNQEIATGPIVDEAEIIRLHAAGHEIGCHTFDHFHAWTTPAPNFGASIARNAAAIQQIIPGYRFATLSYPINFPHPRNKRAANPHFSACRGGGQRCNLGRIDLNCLSSFFLEKTQGKIDRVTEIIDACADRTGWLIFSTHDVSTAPTRYGCHPQFFEDVVEYARARAQILPVREALARCL